MILLGRQELLGLERALDQRLDLRLAGGLLDRGELRGGGLEFGRDGLVHGLRDGALQPFVQRCEAGGLVRVGRKAERGRNRLHRVLLVGLRGRERWLVAERRRIDERHRTQASGATVSVVPEGRRGVAVLLVGDELRALGRPFDAAEQARPFELQLLDPAHRVCALALRSLHVGRVTDVDRKFDRIGRERGGERRPVDLILATVATDDMAELRKDGDPFRRRLGVARRQRGEHGARGQRCGGRREKRQMRSCRSGVHGLTMPVATVPDCR